MKTCMRPVCISITVLCTFLISSYATAQQNGGGYFDPGGIQPFMADVNVGWPGRIWVEANLADNGLGYDGSYVTLGSKQHLFQDFLDGRWLLETQGHYNPEYEGFFGNVGIERVFSLVAAGAEVSTGFWFDYDDDGQSGIGDAMTALGISTSIETRHWELLANGYFPVGDSDFTQGDPTHANCFLGNNIVTQAGIESALQGFDALLNLKPAALAQVNGTFGIGGYAYSSDLVESFAGIRTRVGVQLDGGMIVTAELNHDDRFDFTGVLQVGWLFGAGARGTEYGFLGTDLEPTIRNDHVVRFQQTLMLAIDPDTGRAYDVYHVDNLAAAGGDGSVERPFDNLAAAETASVTDDIIFVREGGGTTRNMDTGITLKDGQMLLGDGVRHLIPLADGTNFVLCNDIDGNLPRITNTGFGNAVNLADRNTVRGLIIDGSQGGLLNGISGDGVAAGSPITGGTIEDVTIIGQPILNGVFLDDIAGNWRFARNNFQTAVADGIFIDNASDPTSTFVFDANIVSNNSRDGIHMEDFDGVSVDFINNITEGNGRDGVRLERFVNSAGTGLALDFINPVSNSNSIGIALEDIAGNVRFINSNINLNTGAGISLVNVTTPIAGQTVFIGTSGGGNSTFTDNGGGTGSAIFNSLDTAFGVERLLITDTTISDAPGNLITPGSGITSQATAVGANLVTDIIDNLGISGTSADGIQLSASGGATHTAQVINTGAALSLANNGANGISINSSGAGPISLVEVDIQNVAITGAGINGIQTRVSDDGQAIVRARNSSINGTGGDGIQITVDNTASTAVSQFDFNAMTISNVGDDGVGITVFDQTFVDFALVNSTLTNAAAGDHGIQITANGDAAVAIDTRLRTMITGNIITGFNSGDGIGINGTGDAHILALIEGNTITNNGANLIAGTPTAPFGDGIDLTATGSSEIFARVVNNNITGNSGQGFDLNTAGTGQVTALLSGNFLGGNDTQTGTADITASNVIGGTVCIALSNNTFNLPAIFTNLSGPASFRVELDGLTNSLAPVFLPNVAAFDVGTFSTVCTPAIIAEETAFALAGFPPLP